LEPNYISFKIDGIKKLEALMGGRIKVLGADKNNASRFMLLPIKLKTDFKRKGKAGKYKAQFALATAITKQRASVMEDSFGNDKALSAERN